MLSVGFGALILVFEIVFLCPQFCLTGDRQLGLLAVSSVGDVGGDAAKQTAVRSPNAGDLQHAVWQQSVPEHKYMLNIYIKYMLIIP